MGFSAPALPPHGQQSQVAHWLVTSVTGVARSYLSSNAAKAASQGSAVSHF